MVVPLDLPFDFLLIFFLTLSKFIIQFFETVDSFCYMGGLIWRRGHFEKIAAAKFTVIQIQRAGSTFKNTETFLSQQQKYVMSKNTHKTTHIFYIHQPLAVQCVRVYVSPPLHPPAQAENPCKGVGLSTPPLWAFLLHSSRQCIISSYHHTIISS